MKSQHKPTKVVVRKNDGILGLLLGLIGLIFSSGPTVQFKPVDGVFQADGLTREAKDSPETSEGQLALPGPRGSQTIGYGGHLRRGLDNCPSTGRVLDLRA